MRRVLEFSAGCLTLSTLLALPIVLRPFRVSGASMTTTFANGDVVLVDTLLVHFSHPKRGDMLVFRNPRGRIGPDRTELDIKRLIGLPGETIHVRRDRVVIDRACDLAAAPLPPAKTDIAAVDGPCQTTYPASSLIGGGMADGNNNDFDMFLGPLDYFVLGDNRFGSIDSRRFGTVQPQHFVGTVVVRIAAAPVTPTPHAL
jgi:signal peptidase I